MISFDTVTKFSQTIAVALFLGVFVLGFWLGGESKFAPAPIIVDSTVSQSSVFPKTEDSKILEEYGINFTYPENYTDITFLMNNIANQRDNAQNIIVSLITDFAPYQFHRIDVSRLGDVPDSQQGLERMLMRHAMYDPLGEHPKNFSEFSSVAFGTNEFYAIRTGLFEGLYQKNYYYISPKGVFAIVSNEQVGPNVDWMSPDFDPDTLPGQNILRTILNALSYR